MSDKKIHNAIPLTLMVITLIGFAYLVTKSGSILSGKKKENG
jgi:hypothetical protein